MRTLEKNGSRKGAKAQRNFCVRSAFAALRLCVITRFMRSQSTLAHGGTTEMGSARAPGAARGALASGIGRGIVRAFRGAFPGAIQNPDIVLCPRGRGGAPRPACGAHALPMSMCVRTISEGQLP